MNQGTYCLPKYLSALNSTGLYESATLFRLKYCNKGAHAGYITHVTDPAQNETCVKSLCEAMRNSKGLGSFKNQVFYAHDGKPDGIKIVPLSEVVTKDDFFNVNKTSADDLLDAHRVPFPLMGGKLKIFVHTVTLRRQQKVFVRNELSPLQDRFREVNDWIGIEVIRFKQYSLIDPE